MATVLNCDGTERSGLVKEILEIFAGSYISLILCQKSHSHTCLELY
jgi:hypothetical protein